MASYWQEDRHPDAKMTKRRLTQYNNSTFFYEITWSALRKSSRSDEQWTSPYHETHAQGLTTIITLALFHHWHAYTCVANIKECRPSRRYFNECVLGGSKQQRRLCSETYTFHLTFTWKSPVRRSTPKNRRACPTVFGSTPSCAPSWRVELPLS